MMLKNKIHYAWFVCIGCALLLFCTSGLSVNTFTIYQPYILKLNEFTNSQSSLIITVRNLFSFASLMLVNRYYKLLPKRIGMGLAGLFIAAGFVLFGFADSFPAYCCAAAVVGLGYGFGTMVPITILISEWFSEKRNTAVGICSAATGLSTLGIPSLISASIVKIGMRKTFLIEAAAIAVLVAVSFLLIRNSPKDKGITPYGTKTDEPQKKLSDIGIGRNDWFLLLPALLLIGAIMNVSYSHLTVHMTSAGFSADEAALAVAVSGIVLTASKIIFGNLGDKKSNYVINYWFSAILLAGLVLLCFIGKSRIIMYGSTMLYSFGLSFTAMGLAVWAGDLSAAKDYDRNVQLFQALYSAGSLLFSSLPGIMADRFGGSYVPAYALFTVLAVYVVFAVQVSYIRISKRRNN